MLTIYVIPNIGQDANDMIIKLLREEDEVFCVLQQDLIDSNTEFKNKFKHSVTYSKFDFTSPTKILELKQHTPYKEYVNKLLEMLKILDVYIKVPTITKPFCNFEELHKLTNEQLSNNKQLYKDYRIAIDKYERIIVLMLQRLIKKHKQGVLLLCLNPIHFRRLENLRTNIRSRVTEYLSNLPEHIDVIYLLEDYIRKFDNMSIEDNRLFLGKFRVRK